MGRDSSHDGLVPRIADVATHLLCLATWVAIVVAAGQPIFTDDLWWHLALGGSYLESGPWLDRDPLLFTAPGPPAPAAWLADSLLAGVDRVGGFQALRLLHVLLLVSILGIVWSILRRVGGSARIASLGTAAFAALAAYRLIQLRPDLFSILAVLLLYGCLLGLRTHGEDHEDRRGDRLRAGRMLATAVLMALWVNLHAAFVLGPLLIAVAIGSVGLMTLSGVDRQNVKAGLDRMVSLGGALVAGLAGTLLNPEGPNAYAPYWRAGASTPSLARVGDEWTPLRLLEWPSLAPGQPSAFQWGVVWLLLGLVVVLLVRDAVRIRRGRAPVVGPVDLALSLVAIALTIVAVRFVWLAVLPLIALARAAAHVELRSALRHRPVVPALAGASLALIIALGFLRIGDWRAITGYLPTNVASYAEPYSATKYHAHTVWLLHDAKLEGNLFNEYHLGGFLGYWLSPRIRTFVNGSLNVSDEAIEANWPLRNRRGVRPGEGFLEALDRLGIELFMGIRPPVLPPRNRPWRFSSGYLEDSPGWTLAFRNLLGSLWIREGERGRANLQRLTTYYADRGLPFDADEGFDPLRVIHEAPDEASAYGLIPADFPSLLLADRAEAPVRRDRARARIAMIYSLLGEHRAAIEIDRPLLERNPTARLVRRRLAWNLVHANRFAEASSVAADPAGRASGPADPLLRRIALVAERAPGLDDEERTHRVATLPLLTEEESRGALRGLAPPPVRSRREAHCGDRTYGSSASRSSE